MRRYVALAIAMLAGGAWAAFAGYHHYAFAAAWYHAAGRAVAEGEPDPLSRYLLFIVATAVAPLIALSPLVFGRRGFGALAPLSAVVAWMVPVAAVYSYIYQGFAGHISIQAFYRYVPAGAIALGFGIYALVLFTAQGSERGTPN